MVVSVSLIRNGYGYGTVPDRRGTIHTESGHGKFRIPNAIAFRIRCGHEPCRELQSTALTSDDLDTPRAPSLLCCLYIYGRTFYTCSTTFHYDMAALFFY